MTARTTAILGKGGVGKTFFASHLTMAFSYLGVKTLVVGCDQKQDTLRALSAETRPPLMDWLDSTDYDYASIAPEQVTVPIGPYADAMELGASPLLVGHYGAVLDEAFLKKTDAEWMELLKAADCICGPVATYDELLDDPQVRANEYIVEVDHPTQGRLPVVGAPWRFSETPAEIAPAAPELGQHSEEILQELGYTWEQIAELREQGALG